MTTTDLILTESRKFGLDDQTAMRLIAHAKTRCLSWAIKRIVRTNEGETLLHQLENVRLLLEGEVSSYTLRYLYYRLAETKVSKTSDRVLNVLNDHFGVPEFWKSVYPCAKWGCTRLAAECLLLDGNCPEYVATRLVIAERTVYNLRDTCVKAILESNAGPK